MKSALAFFATLLTASIAIAQAQTLPVPLAASGLSATLQAKVQQTTFILDQADSYCSVSPITKDGYLLTALHCVRSCLEQNGLSEAGSNAYLGLHEIFVSTRSKNTNVVCSGLSIPALGIKGVTVVETGSALSTFDATFMSAFPNLFNELHAQGFDLRAQDYAILKIQTARDLVCWPLATQAPAAAQPVWALGYPLPDDEKTKPVLSSSGGTIYASALESLAYRSATTSQQQAFVVSQYSNSGIVFSNAQNQPGQSGGPVITADGSVVGVVSGYAETPVASGSVHELVAPNTAFILKSLSPALAQTLVQKSAACR